MIDDDLLPALGAELRNARRSRGLTLRDLDRVSRGSLTAAAVGGWERGERSITVRRFVELARLYGFTPDQLLRDALDRSGAPRPAPIVLDLTRLGTLPAESSEAVGRFAQAIKTKRGDYVSDVLSLRHGDLEVWAAELGTTAEALVDRLYPILAESPPSAGR